MLRTVFKYFPHILIHLILATAREVDTVIITLVFQTRKRVWRPRDAAEAAGRDSGALCPARGEPPRPAPPAGAEHTVRSRLSPITGRRADSGIQSWACTLTLSFK